MWWAFIAQPASRSTTRGLGLADDVRAAYLSNQPVYVPTNLCASLAFSFMVIDVVISNAGTVCFVICHGGAEQDGAELVVFEGVFTLSGARESARLANHYVRRFGKACHRVRPSSKESQSKRQKRKSEKVKK